MPAAFSTPASFTPTAMDMAQGMVYGPDPAAPPLPSARPGLSPRRALEEVVLAALTRPPCGVSFSGGRDSSLVLAVATHVARKEGLAPPIPISHVFPDAPDSREDQWQDLVIGALGLADRVRLTWHGEMDVLGPFATAVLRRVGVLDPFNAFFHEPLCAQVPGGSLLTGIGGDEVLGGVSSPVAFRIRHKGRRPRRRDLGPLALSYAPVPVRASALRRAHPLAHAGWMQPEARAAAERSFTRWMASDPLAWDASVRRFWGSRDCRLGLAGLDALAAVHDVRMIHPLNSGEFLAAMMSAHGHSGPGGRAQATDTLAEGLLPAALVHRPDKAAFGGAFWTGAYAGFADTWTGGGIDPALVDPERLRAEWRKPQGPHVASLMLLQHAWLHDDSRPAT